MIDQAMPPPMLTGYRVLDMTQVVAGPTCTRILAEMGADVIKVELAPGGDRGRASGLKPRNAERRGQSQSTYNFQHNHSKRSIAVDLRQPAARALLRRMADKVDVLVENFSPGVLARAGLGYAALAETNPRLVMCSISFAGQQGSLSGKPGYDYMGQAYSGVASAIGEPDHPAQFSIAIGDGATGMAAAMAVGFALLHRERTGRGQYIESSLLDTWFHMHEVNVPKVSLRGDAFVPGRAGAMHPDGGPTGMFRHSDGAFVAIMVLPHQWPQIVEALGMPELLEDPRFRTAPARRDNNVALQAVIETWLAGFPTREAAIAALEEKRVPCAPVLTLNEAMVHPHLVERRTVRRVSDPYLGDFDIPNLPVRFSDWPERTDLRAGLLGEHNEAVLRELLDLSEEEIATLYRDRTIVRDDSAGTLPNG